MKKSDMIDFLAWLTNEELAIIIYNRYKPKNLADLWRKIDNKYMVAGIYAEYHERVKGYSVDCYSLWHKCYPRESGRFWCQTSRKSEVHGDVDVIKDKVDGYKMLRALRRKYNAKYT